VKDLRRDTQNERKEQSAASPQKTAAAAKDVTQKRRPGPFRLYGVGRRRAEHQSDPFDLYGVEQGESD
jgi:hypothetical protein